MLFRRFWESKPGLGRPPGQPIPSSLSSEINLKKKGNKLLFRFETQGQIALYIALDKTTKNENWAEYSSVFRCIEKHHPVGVTKTEKK